MGGGPVWEVLRKVLLGKLGKCCYFSIKIAVFCTRFELYKNVLVTTRPGNRTVWFSG